MVLMEVQKLHEECAVFGVSLQKHAQEEAPVSYTHLTLPTIA